MASHLPCGVHIGLSVLVSFRWSKDANGEFVMENGKRVLEFIAVQRADTKQWAIPGVSA